MKEIIITSTVLITGVLLIRRLFRGKVSNRLQYALWLLVALRLVIPVSAQIDLGAVTPFRLMDLIKQAEVERGDVVERLEEPIQVTASSRDLTYRLFVSDKSKTAENEMPADGPTSVFVMASLGFSRLDILQFLWITGMLVVGLWIVVSNILFSRSLKKTREPFALSGEETASIAKVCGIKRSDKEGNLRLPRLYLAKNLSSPCLYGLPGREAVYLTADVVEDENRLRHVLVHELVHKKHGDSVWALLRSVLATVYWFHPLVWASVICSKRDCELACDEDALLLLGEGERISYGETLLSIIICKSRLSDLVCTATTMTGSDRSVKERIRFIAEKPKVIYAAVGCVLLLTAFICFFVFTKNPQFDGVTVDSSEGLTVTGADMQIQLPASIGGISGCMVDPESDDVIIYHTKAQREVGRFSNMKTKDALQLVDERREVMPIGYYGNNYLLRVYMGEPVIKTEHTYTPADSETNHTYTPTGEKTQGVLRHEDIYLPNETITVTPMDEDTVSVEMHDYMPSEGIAGTDHVVEGVPGTDSNDDTTYMIDDETSNPMLSDDFEVIPLEEEQAVDYLPNESITTTVYQPQDVNVDEINNGCYVYVKADFGDVQEKYREEMYFIDSELRSAADDVVVLSLNKNRREQLFDALTENRTPYVGDNSKVGNMLTALPLPPTLNRTGDFSLQTLEEPYSLRFSYKMSTDLFTQEDLDMLYFNAAMLFYSIGNVEEITMDVQQPDGSGRAHSLYVYYRETMEKELPLLQEVNYDDTQLFREKLLDLHVAVEEHLR